VEEGEDIKRPKTPTTIMELGMLVRAYFGIFPEQKMKRLFLHSSIITYNSICMGRQFGLIWEIRLKRIYELLR
jgi:hypothetical protein